MNAIIQVKSLRKTYGDIEAVKGVSFDVGQGEIFSLLGPNGAGKTTTISMLSCLLSPTGGDARVDGHFPRRRTSTSGGGCTGYRARCCASAWPRGWRWPGWRSGRAAR
jgi:ABC-type multidrug transport system ATPase subunit